MNYIRFINTFLALVSILFLHISCTQDIPSDRVVRMKCNAIPNECERELEKICGNSGGHITIILAVDDYTYGQCGE